MRRIVSYQYTEAIQAALACFPNHIARELEKVDIFTGTDTEFAGIAPAGPTEDGRSYKDTWHLTWDANQKGLAWCDRRVMMVLPCIERGGWARVSLVHEFAHVLDHRLKFLYSLPPVTEYALTNRQEAFAEGICDHIFKRYADLNVYADRSSPLDRDQRAQQFLRALWRGDVPIWDEDRLWG